MQHTTIHFEACTEPPLYELASLVAPQRALLRHRAGTSVLDVQHMYELFQHTVVYRPHCQGLQCMWVAGGVSVVCPFGRAGCAGRAGASVYARGVARVCQLVGGLINTSLECQRDEIFVASKIEHIGVMLAWLLSGGGGELESCAAHTSFVLILR